MARDGIEAKGTLGDVISIERLRANLDGGWVAFDRRGVPVHAEIPGEVGPAFFVVTPVTEAVKRVEGGQVSSLDRDGMWGVEAIVVNDEILSRLEGREMTVDELVEAVRALGYRWEVSQTSDL